MELMLRFRDNFKSYYDRGVFRDSRGRAIYAPSLIKSGVAVPPGHNHFYSWGSTFIDPANTQSRYHLHTTWVTSYLDHLHRELALFPRSTYTRPLDSVVSALRRSVVMNI